MQTQSGAADEMPPILKEPEVKFVTRRSRAQRYRDERADPPRFPRRIKLGPNSVGWLKSEIDAWIAERAAERQGRDIERTARS